MQMLKELSYQKMCQFDGDLYSWSNSLKQCLVADDRQLWNEFLTTFWCAINFFPTILIYDQFFANHFDVRSTLPKMLIFYCAIKFFPKIFHLRSTFANCFDAGSSFLPKCFAQKKWTSIWHLLEILIVCSCRNNIRRGFLVNRVDLLYL